jgi:hypothetical protein
MAQRKISGAEISGVSRDPADKMCACLNHTWTKDAYKLAPDYFDACARWWGLLSADQREIGNDMISFHDRDEAVLELAADLPDAPKFPRDLLAKRPSPLVSFAVPRELPKRL